MKVIASMGVVFTAPVISLKAWFWARSGTLSVCGWAVTRGSQLYVITGRMHFWYVRFKFDRAHPHLLPARRFRTFVRLETREAIYLRGFSSLACCRRSLQGTWIHLIGRELCLYTSTLDVLFCELGRRTERLFLRNLSSYYFSHTIFQVWPMPCLFCLFFCLSFIYLSPEEGLLHIVNIWCQG